MYSTCFYHPPEETLLAPSPDDGAMEIEFASKPGEGGVKDETPLLHGFLDVTGVIS